jgi:hypothetical protein
LAYINRFRSIHKIQGLDLSIAIVADSNQPDTPRLKNHVV